MLWLIFSASIMLRSMAAIAGKGEVHPPALTDSELPDYTIVVALYREARVVEDLVRALDGFDYPKSKLDIKLVVEQRDAETLSRLVELRLPARYEIIVAPPGPPQTKPRALNIALVERARRAHRRLRRRRRSRPGPIAPRRRAFRRRQERRLSAGAAHDPESRRILARRSCLRSNIRVLFDFLNPGLCALNCRSRLAAPPITFASDRWSTWGPGTSGT